MPFPPTASPPRRLAPLLPVSSPSLPLAFGSSWAPATIGVVAAATCLSRGPRSRSHPSHLLRRLFAGNRYGRISGAHTCRRVQIATQITTVTAGMTIRSFAFFRRSRHNPPVYPSAGADSRASSSSNLEDSLTCARFGGMLWVIHRATRLSPSHNTPRCSFYLPSSRRGVRSQAGLLLA